MKCEMCDKDIGVGVVISNNIICSGTSCMIKLYTKLEAEERNGAIEE